MESKKQKGLPVWAAIIISVLAVAILVLGVLLLADYLKNRESNPFKSYTASESELIENRDRVIAKVGDYELTNAELQVYYWIYVYSFMEENSYYLSMMGFDYTKDFGTQECFFEKGISWQEYFIDQALAAWYQYAVLNIGAEKAEYKLPAEEQAYLDTLKETLDKVAKENKLEGAEDLIKKEMGVGASWDAYVKYSNETFKGMGYYNQFAEDIKLTEEDLAKHYADNLKEYEDNKIAKKDEAYCVSVRHILISPVATKDENGKDVITDAAWADCKAKAEKLLADYRKSGKIDEEAFAALAKEHTEDTGSKTNGGLYSNFTRGKMVAEFEAWSFDAARKYGDTDLVKTTYGYHIMFFVDGDETYSTSVRHILISPVATKDENGKDVITDAAWADCKAKAEKLLADYRKSGKIDEEAFAALAKEHTEDTGSKTTGGLYSNVVRGKMVAEFEAWSFDAARKYGDTGLVKTTYGYHIMFFVEKDVEWRCYADYALRMDACENMLKTLKEQYPINADYNKILIGHIELGK